MLGDFKSIVLMAINLIQQQSTGGFMSESVTIKVSGMKCGGCENTVNSRLSGIDGILSVAASHQNKLVVVEYDPSKIDLDEIEDTITEAGFSVE